MKIESTNDFESFRCVVSTTCEVVEEVEGDGEAGGLRVEHGRLSMT